MKFSKREIERMKQIDDMMDELNKCGDEQCGNIITAKEMKEEGLKYFKLVREKCNSKSVPKNAEEDKIQREKKEKCYKKYQNQSTYNKRLTLRKKCEDKKCGMYKNKLNDVATIKHKKKKARKQIVI